MTCKPNLVCQLLQQWDTESQFMLLELSGINAEFSHKHNLVWLQNQNLFLILLSFKDVIYFLQMNMSVFTPKFGFSDMPKLREKYVQQALNLSLEYLISVFHWESSHSPENKV